MRIAFISDIHGNLHAFEAVLAHAKKQGYDQLIIAGDVVSGPDSLACWQLAQSLGCPIVRGNHERYIFDVGTPNADPLWETLQFAPLRWAASRFSQEERDDMRALPTSLRLPDAPDMLIVHASQRSDNDPVAQHTPAELLQEMFPDPQASLIVRGHNHVCATRIWGERTIVTVGSTGLPLDSHTTAHYSILEKRKTWQINSFSVPYNLEATLARYEQSGYLAAGGPIAKLFMREVATATFCIVPFLKSYRRWQAEEDINLEHAVQRFLAG